ncbi:MAG: formate dehydrogenase [Deltaproteobacteria bacterium]|nr:MAG: formate dehydrogenase [Deltaproteobacteria bacterium]
MSNHWTDIQNARLVLVGGGNPAENHPLGFRHVEKAMEAGAKLVVVDPRLTRTAALAHHFLQIRPGTDLVYLAALIRHVIETEAFDAAYVDHHTNARMRLSGDFGFEAGLFSGWQRPAPGEEVGRYDTRSWAYRLSEEGTPLVADDRNEPDTVFSAMRAHFSRYTFEVAERLTGIPATELRRLAELFCERRPATILYALGMTQHTTGAQAIRCYAILQLLLGNMGRPGGGLNACRGESNVQGSSDLAALPHILPGYLPVPRPEHDSLDAYERAYGTLTRRRLAALCTAWWGSPAGYRYLPRIDRSPSEYSWSDTFHRMHEGAFDLFLLLAENPAVSAPNAGKVVEALGRLRTLVVIDLFETETATFWKRPGVDPRDVDTEVYLLPGAYGAEKQGSITNSGRWIQWGEKAIDPPGEARSDAEIIDGLARAVRAAYAGDSSDRGRAVTEALWDYAGEELAVDEERVLQEIGGRDLFTGRPLESTREVTELPEGQVACGQWLYAGVYGGGENRTKRRGHDDGSGTFSKWAWAWPDNVRILYNRASADLEGRPRDSERPYVWWDEERGRWCGVDVPDLPDLHAGPEAPAFFRLAEARARLFLAPYRSPDGRLVDRVLADGPLPEHYEPVESPVDNPLHPGQSTSPLVRLGGAVTGDRSRFPHVLTTHDVVEHWLSGTVTTRVPPLVEAIPGPFVELSRNLGDRLGIRGGERVVVETARGAVTLPAVVTGRIPPLWIEGRRIEVVSLHWAWGWSRPHPAEVANLLTLDVVEPNAGAPEYKSALCQVRRAR